MESSDSSPNYSRATTSFIAKTENSPGSSECDEIISVTSSTCGSANNTPKQNNTGGIKYRTNNNKTSKTFVSVRSFHRRRSAKSRTLQSHVALSDEDSSIDSSLPHYLKATSSSKGKKTHSESSQTKPSKTLSRTSSSLRNVRILIRKTSFKPKRSSLAYSKDVSVDRATHSSTLKDTKFPDPVQLHSGEAEPEEVSAVKVCRYHHCSLHGHCHENHEPVPPLKQFVYKRRQSLKKQRSCVPKPESKSGAKNSNGKKKIHQPLNQEEFSHSLSSSVVETKNEEEVRSFGDGCYGFQESDLLEVAFGEISFPERSYEDNVNIHRKYSSQEQDYCLKCSCNKREQDMSYIEDIATSRFVNEASEKDCPETPGKDDEVTRKKSMVSSSDNNSDEGESITESTISGGSNVNEAIQVKDSDMKSPAREGSKLQFSKPRHISMWNLIHQHMSTNSPVKPENKAFEGGESQSPVSGANSLPAKGSISSNRDLSDSDVGKTNNDSENQEIEIRKLFAIKLVREAIEKILLPEIQDQTSDDQSVTSENTPRQELFEETQSKACTEENQAESDADKGEGSVIITRENDDDVRKKAEKKAPKHWSNLKKWILLQRFIGALEKVRRFNPKKPQLLPLNPDPEAEKVNLRPQTVDGRRNSEEWMLDYALRQAVNQLGPTQKKKVALLVKAFDTVVPSQEEAPLQFRIPKLVENKPQNGKASEETGVDRAKKTENPSSKTQSSILDGNGKSLACENGKESEETGVDRTNKTENPSSKTQSSILDGNGKSLASENSLSPAEIIADDRERGTMLTVEGLQEDVELSDMEGKEKESDEPIQIDGKIHIKMWHMIYQHVVSGIAEKIGSQLLDGVEDDEVENASPALDGGHCPNDSTLHLSGILRSGFTKSDALKLVKEAVDEIRDDSSDTQSVSSESMSEQIGGQDIVSTNEESKAGLLKSKNWGKLKKLMLLKRSIRALEKARKPKPKAFQQFAQIPDPEPEKIDLKSQMMDERKKAEQWMLDYAVQHIVTKLTPARKRRVHMLVEAFEAVVPFPEM